LAGVAIAVFEAANVLILNAATFLASAALVTLLVPPPERGAGSSREGSQEDPPEEGSRDGYLSDLAGARASW
jgi:hypothetical protein